MAERMVFPPPKDPDCIHMVLPSRQPRCSASWCCSEKSISVCNPPQNNHISATAEIPLADNNRFIVPTGRNYRICPLPSNHELLILSRTAHRQGSPIRFSMYPSRTFFKILYKQVEGIVNVT